MPRVCWLNERRVYHVSCSTLSHRLSIEAEKNISPRAHEKLSLGFDDCAASIATSKGKGIIVGPCVVFLAEASGSAGVMKPSCSEYPRAEVGLGYCSSSS